jgi:hypothetical protein
MDDKAKNPEQEAALEGFPETRRAALRRLVGMGAYVVPAVTTVSMSALSMDGFMHTAAACV